MKISTNSVMSSPDLKYPSRIFEHPNPVNFKCPICRSKADAPVVLVPIPGTERDDIVECEQVHRKCYDLLHKMNNLSWV